MIRLDAALTPPDLQPTRLNMPEMDPRSAEAPARALGQLAEGIAAIAQPFQEHAERVQQMEDARLSTLKQTAYEEGYARQLQDSQADPALSPAQRLQANTQWLVQNKPDTADLSPQAAAGFNNWLEQTNSHYRIQLGATAMRDARLGALQASTRRIQSKIAAGDPAAAKAEVHQLREQNLASPAEADELHHYVDQQAANHATLQQIAAAPRDYIDQHSGEPSEDDPHAADPVTLQNRLQLANRYRRQDTARLADSVHNAIASSDITRPDQIDAALPHLDEDARKVFKDTLATLGDPAQRARLATPAWHDEAAGRLARLFHANPPGQDISDKDYLTADSLLRTLPPSPLADQYQHTLALLRDGQPDTRNDPFQQGRTAIDLASHAGLFHPPVLSGEKARTLADQNYGQCRTNFESWAARNPGADDKAILAKADGITSPFVRSNVLQNIIPLQPSFPPAGSSTLA